MANEEKNELDDILNMIEEDSYEETEEQRLERLERRRKERMERARQASGSRSKRSQDGKRQKSRPKKKSREEEYNPFAALSEDEPHHSGIVPVIIALLMMLIILGAVFGAKFYEKYSYSKEIMDLTSYYKVEKEGQMPMLLADEIIEEKALWKDGSCYLPLDFTQKYLNKRFYYSASESLLLFTTPESLYEIPLGSSSYTIDGQPQSFSEPIIILQEEIPYISLEYMKGYANFVSDIYDAPKRIQIFVSQDEVQEAEIVKDTAIRYQGGVKSEILEQVRKGEVVVVLETMENWSKVKSEDGVIGYVENKRLAEQVTANRSIPITYNEPVYSSIHRDHTINMAWHQVTNVDANDTIYGLLENTKSVNVVSPTWYFLNDNFGDFTSIASLSYVEDMHARGIEVWALIDNFTNDVEIEQILGSLPNRKNLVSQLIEESLRVGVDGINIDFEQVPDSAGNDYVQFLRELSIACRKNQLVLSVDNYVPTGYTAHYDRAEQGVVCDYVVIMGYDEHYSGSAEAGSVASIEYVKQGIEKTVAVVPEEKVINGVPFYTRLWKLADGVSSESLGMGGAQNVLAEHGVTAAWDEATCQNYASFEADGVTYQIWMEDVDSMQARLGVMSTYHLGGIAQWKLGLEKAEVWDHIAAYVAENDSKVGANTSGATEEVLEEEPTEEIDAQNGGLGDAEVTE